MTSQLLFNDQFQVLLLSMVPGLPLVVAFVLFVPAWQRVGMILAPWSALPALGAAVFLKPGINLEVAWFFMGGRMGIDLLGQRFLLLAALVWQLSAFFGRSYLRNDPRRCSFFFFYLISMAFNFGLILAQDMLGFYLFFALMSFSAYGLIVHTRSEEARLAGKVYIVLVMVGEVLLFSGMVLMASHLPDLKLSTMANSRPASVSVLLFFLGFAIKAGALPLHVWLPLAHPVAPVPASAVLSGVMIKAGLLGWLRFLPTGQEVALPGWGVVFVVLGLLAAFYGVVVGLTQQEPKTILAYSSISQMGLMTMIVGCGLLSPAWWPQVKNAVTIYVLHHGLAKAALFLGTGLVKEGGRQRPAGWVMVLLLLPCLALAGLPLTSGAIAKFAVKEIVHGVPAQWAAALEFVLPLSAFMTMLLLCHFLRIISVTVSSPKSSTALIPAAMVIPWLVLLAAGGILLWCWPLRPQYSGHITDMDLLWQGLWPVALGWVVMYSYWQWWTGKTFTRLRGRFLAVPAGDILWLVYGRGKKFMGLPGEISLPRVAGKAAAGARHVRKSQGLADQGRRMEKRLRRWGVVGSCYLFLWFVFLFLLLRS